MARVTWDSGRGLGLEAGLGDLEGPFGFGLQFVEGGAGLAEINLVGPPLVDAAQGFATRGQGEFPRLVDFGPGRSDRRTPAAADQQGLRELHLLFADIRVVDEHLLDRER